MRKLVFSIFINLIFITVLAIYSQNLDRYYDYYSIPKNHCYINNESTNMKFDIYTKDKNSLILNKDINTYYLVIKNEKYLLRVNKVDINPHNDLFIITIYTDVIKDFDIQSKNVYLEINNHEYNLRLKIGSISLLDTSEYKLLNFDKLYGSYTMINNKLILVGIYISFFNTYNILEKVEVGNFAYGLLQNIIYDKELNNEIDILYEVPNYKISDDTIESINLKSKNIFIPLGYKYINFIDETYITLVIDGEKYYIDTFPYITNYLDYNEYFNMLEKGEIVYVKS